ncbi:MAG: ATP-dependent DNA helicase RecG [Flavobacteriales bacterium]
MSEHFFDIPLSAFSGLGHKKAAIIQKFTGAATYGDLLHYFPYRYIDRSVIRKIKDLQDDNTWVQVLGIVKRVEQIGQGAKKRLVIVVQDDTASLELVWFQGINYILPKIKTDSPYLIFGKPSLFNGKINITHPEIELYTEALLSQKSAFQPMYHSSEAMKRAWLDSKGIERIIRSILQQATGKIPENLPDELLNRFQLMPREEAFKQTHRPSDDISLQRARYRLKFEELLFLQLKLIRNNRINKQVLKGFTFSSIGNYFHDFYTDYLPFPLTNAQKRVLKEIRADVAKPIQMNRLLQGDVGSGKTIVALMSMLMAADNGFQACLMAPTEILAQQHFDGLSELIKNMPLKISLLTGSTKKSARRQIHEKLQDGSLHFLVGTHALLEDEVIFKNLGLVVIDEQHRYGVAQRARLWYKNNLPPHILAMSATPIPRTLAMTLYGDLDISVIDELPPGRKPITTVHCFESKRLEVYEFIKSEIRKGRQAYIVYPLIEESEQLDYKNLMDGYDQLMVYFPRPEYQISIVHGRMKSQEKDMEMQRFLERKTNIMIATTVIEVGVNVPNASVMLIESAERFGLSQLHQLRGRVGRGAEQSYCILMTGFKLSADAKIRLETMERTNNGFEIADVDLRLRGPGDLQGTQQSGLIQLKMADLSTDSQLLQQCRNIASDIINEDENLTLPKHNRLSAYLAMMQKKSMNWGRIS